MSDEEPKIRSKPCEHCYVCKTEGQMIYKDLFDRLFGSTGKWNLRKCNNPDCGSTWLDPMPLECDLHIAYKSYYTHENPSANIKSSEKKINLRRFIRYLEQLWIALLFQKSERNKLEHMYLKDSSPGYLLEVGCGDGARLNTMHQLGWTVEGQDIDSNAIKNVQQTYGFNTHLGDLIQLQLPQDSYDAIIMNHVIEHVYDPITLLQECRRLLKPNGVVVITTPNPNSYGHHKYGSSWRGLEVPRHLRLFTVKGLKQTAMSAGFSKQSSWTTSARAGGILAASFDIKKLGQHRMRGQITANLIVSAMLYQLTARIAYLFRKDSGEESVLFTVK